MSETGFELLRKVGQPGSGRQRDGASRWRHLAGQGLEQARFAAPVRADDAQPLPWLELEGQLAQDEVGAVHQRQPLDSDQGHHRQVYGRVFANSAERLAVDPGIKPRRSWFATVCTRFQPHQMRVPQ